ncbi:MAG: hypothetical protein NWF04_10730 [Candidatus Bathyarchaeota archaeon]|nr:hypothetical protein [Candidatus Bathyarchaeota archaeon]
MAFANLLIQIGILLLLGLSLYLKKKKKFVWHGNVMLVAVLINGLMLISHMGPSLVYLLRVEVPVLDLVAIVGLFHGIVGAVAEFLGIWLVATWAFIQSETNYCLKRTKLMRLILATWMVALALGFVYYLLHIVFG